MGKLENRHPSGLEEVQVGSRLSALDGASIASHLSSEQKAPNEGLYRFVAYSSGYLFWLTVIGLSAGIVLL